MTTTVFIIELFCRIDDAMPNAKKAYPSQFASQRDSNPGNFVCLERCWQSGFLSLGRARLQNLVSEVTRTHTALQIVQQSPPLDQNLHGRPYFDGSG